MVGQKSVYLPSPIITDSKNPFPFPSFGMPTDQAHSTANLAFPCEIELRLVSGRCKSLKEGTP
jgi:hypothetical protein